MSDITQEMSTKAAASSTILVVEPDILVRMVIADYLRECGYTVIEGVNADDALTLLRAKFPVQILLTEVRLRGAADWLWSRAACAPALSWHRCDLDIQCGLSRQQSEEHL